MYNVEFPGLGIGPFTISDTAFSIFGLDIKWYGIFITVGMILACLYAYSRAKIEKISADDLIDYVLFTIIFGILGARLYYVLFELDSYIITAYDSVWKNIWESFKAIIGIWNGGLAIYGGIIAGIITIIIVSKKKKIPVLKFLDVAAPSVMIGQALGRWGNFTNQEAFGSNTTLPWGMYSNGTYSYLLRNQASLAAAGITVDPSMPVHPTFLYESLWNLIGLLIIHLLYKKKNYNGQIFLMYVSWYGFGRMIIEGFRTDSLMLGPFRISQLLAFVSFLAAAIILIVMAIKGTKTVDFAKEASGADKGNEETTPEEPADETKESNEDLGISYDPPSIEELPEEERERIIKLQESQPEEETENKDGSDN